MPFSELWESLVVLGGPWLGGASLQSLPPTWYLVAGTQSNL